MLKFDDDGGMGGSLGAQALSGFGLQPASFVPQLPAISLRVLRAEPVADRHHRRIRWC